VEYLKKYEKEKEKLCNRTKKDEWMENRFYGLKTEMYIEREYYKERQTNEMTWRETKRERKRERKKERKRERKRERER
jgi:hypothetical protein